MDVREAVAKRRSVREYTDQAVSQEAVNVLIEAAHLAPSANNRQDWKFIIIRDKEVIANIAEISGQDFISTAPLVIAGVGLNPTRVMRCDVPPYAVDVTIALTQITLVATSLGLGSCWIGGFPQEPMRELLGVPEDCKIVQLLTIGYPADEPRRRIRKPITEIVSYNHF